MIFSTLYKAGWPILLALGLAVSTASCSSEAPSGGSSDPVDIDEPGSTKGELTAYVATLDDGTSETNYYLRVASGEELKLSLHQPITVDPGTVLRVWGPPTHDGIDVTSLRVVAPPVPSAIGSSSSALVGGAPLADRNFCVVLIDLNGTALTVTATAAANQFFDGATSINSYYRENSYGVQGVDGAVYGPFPYTMAACANNDTNAMASAMRTQVAMANGGTAPACTQYAYIFSRTNICAFGGLGALGSPTAPARDTWYNGSISCVVTVQEPGHNFGMQHSSSMACAGGTFADDPNTCTHSEYGDPYDPMGGGCRHMNVWQKEYQQWFGGCNSVKVSSTGDFNLSPTELPCDGPQALQITMPRIRPFTRPAAGGGGGGTDMLTSYYIEYRTAVGFDGGNASPFATPTVLLHVGADYKTLTTGTRARNTGVHTWLLDMHPTAGQAANQQFRDAGFRVGETFTDPLGGLSITVSAMDATKATVHVEIAGGTDGPVCLDGTPYVASATMCTGPTGGVGDGGGGIIVPPPPDAGSTPGTGGARVDAGREASAVPTPEAGAGGATGTGGSTPGSGGAGGASVAMDAASMGSAGDIGVGGSPGTSGGAGDAAGQAGSSPLHPGGPPGPVQGGCSCRVGANGASRGGSDVAGGLALLFGLAGTRLRRRRTASSARA